MIAPRWSWRGLGVAIAGTSMVVALVGCSGSATTANCDQLSIGFMGPITGEDAGYGTPIRNGAALAVAEYNDEHPDCPVGFIEFDSQGDPDQARTTARQIADDDHVLAVVGPSFSGEAEQALPVFVEAGVPIVTPSATNPDLGTQEWPVFHRVVGTDATQGPAVALYLHEGLRADRVAVIDDGSSYGRRIADLAALTLEQRGAEVPVRTAIDPESRDYRQTVEAVAASDVDAVYFGGIGDPGGQLLRQLRDAGLQQTFAGSDGILQEPFITTAGSAAEGALVTCPCARNAAASGDLTLFTERYLDAFGVQPGSFGAESFDAAALILEAIEGGARSRDAVETWLDSADVAGITRQLRFDEKGEVAVDRVFVYRVEDGTFVPVARVEENRIIQ